jgi:hypothetical protein
MGRLAVCTEGYEKPFHEMENEDRDYEVMKNERNNNNYEFVEEGMKRVWGDY